MKREHLTPRRKRTDYAPRDPRPPLRRTRGGKHMTPDDRLELIETLTDPPINKAAEFDRMVASGQIETVTTIKILEHTSDE